MDTDNSGAITFDELKAGLRKYGSTMKDAEIRDLMDAVRFLFPNRLVGLAYLHVLLLIWSLLCWEIFFIHCWCFKELSCFGSFQADVDNSGTIDYGEFIAATVHLNKLEREEHLVAAFRYFDKDASGYITVDELQQACAEHNMTDVLLEDIIKEVDQDNVSH